jgi:hypothetical protein
MTRDFSRSGKWSWGVLALALAACAPPEGDEPVGANAIESSPLLVQTGGTSYALECQTNGVPLPPPWGGSTQAANWTPVGTPNNLVTDNWAVGKSYIYMNQSSQGLCVIAAHEPLNVGDPKGVFDVICQGTNGRACFWEGVQKPAPPPTSQPSVILASPTQATTFVQSGTELGPLGTCTRCHVGENVFITHNKSGHPLSGIGISNWRPTAWYEPHVPEGNQNPGPDPMTGYPAGTQGAGNCRSCHSGTSTGGRFPRIIARDMESTTANPVLVGSYCDILSLVTNKPGSAGGMPPNLACTPNVDCAKQTDPFVKAMLETCKGIAVSRANSPVAFEAYSQTTPFQGSWDHSMADVVTSSGAHKILLFNNFWNHNWNPSAFAGWSQTDLTSELNTDFRTTMWLKGGGGNNGSNLAMAATDPSGTIWEKMASGARRNVTFGSPQPAAGSPYAFTRHDGTDVIVFRGADSWIYEAWWHAGGNSWITNQLPGQGSWPALGDPIGYSRGASSSVVFKCGAQAICELRLTSAGWQPLRVISTSTYIKPFVVTPMVNWNSGTRTIFYTGENGIHGIADNTDPGFGPTSDGLLVLDKTAVSAAAPYSNQDGRSSVVYINDAGGSFASQVIQLNQNVQGVWTAETIYVAQKSVETLAGDPAAYIATAPWLNTILFRNSAGKLYQRQRSPTSTAYVTTVITPQ